MIHAGRSRAWERARNFSIIDVPAASSTRGYRLTDERDVADDASPELAIDAARQPARRNARTGSTDPIGRTRRRRRPGGRPPRGRAPPPRPARRRSHKGTTQPAPLPLAQLPRSGWPPRTFPLSPQLWQSCEASPLFGAREVLVHRAFTKPSVKNGHA